MGSSGFVYTKHEIVIPATAHRTWAVTHEAACKRENSAS